MEFYTDNGVTEEYASAAAYDYSYYYYYGYYYYGNGYYSRGMPTGNHLTGSELNTTTATVQPGVMPVVAISSAYKAGFENFDVPDIDVALSPPPSAPMVPTWIDNVPSVETCDDSWTWAVTKAFFSTLATNTATGAYDFANHVSVGMLDADHYNNQVESTGNRLYNVAKNLGYSDESISSGLGLAQALAGEVTGTNFIAEGAVGYDLGTNMLLDGWERAEKLSIGISQAATTVAGGLKAVQAKSSLKSCFLAGTLISRYAPEHCGEKELTAIENVRFGDRVWAYNSTMSSEIR